MDSQFEIIIVGAGPAGLTAAIYASRANMKVLLLEQESPGGKLVKTYKIENYTGVQSSSGVDLAMSFMNHGLAFGAEIDFGEVVKVESSDKIKRVVLADGREFTAKAVIVATGTKERPLDVAMAERFTGRESLTVPSVTEPSIVIRSLPLSVAETVLWKKRYLLLP